MLQPCFYVPPSLRFRSTGYATTPPSVGAKGAVDQKNVRRYPVGTLSNGRPAVNNSYLSSNTPARAAGVQRKLELDHQVKPESNHKMTKEDAMNQPWSRLPPPVRSNGNYLAKEQIPRAPDIAEKLSQLSMASNRAPVLSSDRFADLKARTHGDPVRRPLPFGSRAWHAPNDPFRRTYEMPGERAILQRKLVS
jgi:protein kinase